MRPPKRGRRLAALDILARDVADGLDAQAPDVAAFADMQVDGPVDGGAPMLSIEDAPQDLVVGRAGGAGIVKDVVLVNNQIVQGYAYLSAVPGQVAAKIDELRANPAGMDEAVLTFFAKASE